MPSEEDLKRINELTAQDSNAKPDWSKVDVLAKQLKDAENKQLLELQAKCKQLEAERDEARRDARLVPEMLRVLGNVHEYFCYHFPGDVTNSRMNLLHNKVKEALRKGLGIKMGDDIFAALRERGLY